MVVVSIRAVENGANSLGKNLPGHWLLNQLDAGIKAALTDDVVSRIAAHVQDPDPRLTQPQFLHELSTIHSRQHHIGQQQIHLDVIAIDYSERRVRVVRLKDAEM